MPNWPIVGSRRSLTADNVININVTPNWVIILIKCCLQQNQFSCPNGSQPKRIHTVQTFCKNGHVVWTQFDIGLPFKRASSWTVYQPYTTPLSLTGQCAFKNYFLSFICLVVFFINLYIFYKKIFKVIFVLFYFYDCVHSHGLYVKLSFIILFIGCFFVSLDDTNCIDVTTQTNKGY